MRVPELKAGVGWSTGCFKMFCPYFKIYHTWITRSGFIFLNWLPGFIENIMNNFFVSIHGWSDMFSEKLHELPSRWGGSGSDSGEPKLGTGRSSSPTWARWFFMASPIARSLAEIAKTSKFLHIVKESSQQMEWIWMNSSFVNFASWFTKKIIMSYVQNDVLRT